MIAEPQATERPALSLVVPAFNEEQRLGDSLARVIAFGREQAYSVEIIVVDDGSADGTFALAEAAGERPAPNVTLRSLRHEQNRGKGAAVRTGAQAAMGETVLYLDADLSTPPDEVPKLLAALEDGADVAIGSRLRPEGGDMRASQPAWRRIGGRLFATVRRRLLLGDIDDTQCGFKAFTRAAATELFARQQLEGWAFDAELLYLAQRLGFTVRQVPITWQHVEGSQFRLGAGPAMREIRDLLRIRWMHRGVRKPPAS